MADIRDLAKHLNISTGTVSRALNNRSGVNAETRQRVLNAAIELGYAANQSGRNLRRGSTNTIGFVIETGNPANQEGGEFFYVIMDELNLFLAERGYDLVILPCHSADDPVEFLARVVARGTVDALIITATRRQDQRIDLLSRSRLPFMTLGRSETPGTYPWIDLDFEGVAQQSVAELVRLGHRRIAVGLPSSDAMLGYVYRRGFVQAMAAAGLTVDESLIFRTATSEAGGFDLGQRVAALADRPTAILLCSEATTVGLYAGLQRLGIEPGVDLSIITFRENPQMRFLVPAPVCYHVDLASIGRMLGEAVTALLAEDESIRNAALDQKIVVPMGFVPGASVTAP